MNNQLTTHTHDLFGNLRTVMIDGEVYFVAKDAASALNYSDPDQAVRTHCRKPVVLTGIQKGRAPKGIPESDLYRLIMRSDKPEAETFQDWVTESVLPAIRKDGMYVMGEEKVDSEESLEEMTMKVMTPASSGTTP